jgi:hypothetical protein
MKTSHMNAFIIIDTDMAGTVSFGLFALALTVTGCLAAIGEVKNNSPVTQKPGRFLSLPVPQKCSQSKWIAKLL